MKQTLSTFHILIALLAIIAGAGWAADQPLPTGPFKYRIQGLCCKEREEHLRETIASMENMKLAAVDFDNAEVTLDFDPAVAFPKVKAEKLLENLNNKFQHASRSTFKLVPLSTTPKDKLTQIEIPIIGLDCPACCLSVYEYVYKIDGVEYVIASFKEGRLLARIDATKTSREALIEVIKKRGVPVKEPPGPPKPDAKPEAK